MQDVLYVPGLKKNLLYIYALDAKGIRVSFVDGQVLMWPEGNTIEYLPNLQYFNTYMLDSGKPLKMKYVLYVLVLKKNLLSIYALDAKGVRVSFVDGQVLMWPKGKTIEDATVIGEEDGGLYKLKGQPA